MNKKLLVELYNDLNDNVIKELALLSGLTLENEITLRESDELRFNYLFTECSPPDFKLEDKEDYSKDWEKYFYREAKFFKSVYNPYVFMKEEKNIDTLRDELNRVIKEIEEEIYREEFPVDIVSRWLENLKKRPKNINSYDDLPIYKFSKKLQNNIKHVYNILYDKKLLHKERIKLEFSNRIYEHLSKNKLQFRRIFIEGILGNYSFNARLITLYPRMIDLVFSSFVKYGFNANSNSSKLKYIVIIHEAVHAVWHLGKDKNDYYWKEPAEYSVALHETIAQYYTWKIIHENDELKDLFIFLNKRQSYEYNLFKYLDNIEPETVRFFFLNMRREIYQDFIYIPLWENILTAIDYLYEFHFNRLTEEQKDEIKSIVTKIMDGEILFDKSSEFLTSDIKKFLLETKFSHKEDIILLYLEHIYRNCERNGDSSYFTIEALKKASELTKPEIPRELLNHPVVSHLMKIFTKSDYEENDNTEEFLI